MAAILQPTLLPGCRERWPGITSIESKQMEQKDKLLITTAISYTNGSPHIGHLYEAILADFIKRVHQVINHLDVKLLTGTDEHGKKIQTTAQDQNLTPSQLCDKYSTEFKEMNQKINSSYDYFIRTTDNLISL